MCELFGMSSRRATDVRASLEAFARRGGLDGRQKDGWGLAYYVDGDVRLVKEADPAADSACVRFIQDHPFASQLVLSHIRKATRGSLAMKNCQPFARELGGRMHVFAHNGDLDPGALAANFPLRRFHPVGDTDSEYAFCVLLDRLWSMEAWLQLPALEDRRALVAQFAAQMRTLGPANFIYSDGDALFMHGHRRFHGDGQGIHPPGLHVLCRRCAEAAPSGGPPTSLPELAQEQTVVLAASVPLTDEPGWRTLDEGELVVASNGRIVPGSSARRS
jgi:predicted glutamine amidotransferase